MAQYQPTPQAGSAPPLDWPWYGIGFGAAVKRFFQKYATFTGRASRGEYWWVTLFNALVYIVVLAITGLSGGLSTDASGSGSMGPAATAVSSIFGLYYLAVIVPSLALTVRRLHDTGRSGWFIFFSFIPLVGGIILLVFLASQTTPSAEQYGPPGSQGGYGYGGGYGGGQQTYPPSQGYTA